jgi:dTDP-4-dehydrorhamnose reductase
MTANNKALVLGGETGLVGQALMRALTDAGWEAHGLSRRDVDFRDSDAASKLEGIIDRLEPSCLFNCVAFTNVDAAEDDVEGATLLNRTVPAMLARMTKTRPCRLVHYSTDFVFNGKKQAPYTTEDAPDPLGVYGKTKLAGEEAILGMDLRDYCIIRTAWVFGPGRRNFISAILGKCRDKEPIRVVHDQVGSPTYSVDLAHYTLKLVKSGASGLFHVANSGQANRCELADEAVDISQFECVVQPVSSAEFPQKAQRPAWSVLDCTGFTRITGVTPRPWPQALREYVYQEFPLE